MTINTEAAVRFIESSARLLDRHLTALHLADGPVDPVLTTLRAYQNDDGGFGHALEPDIRCPGSQPAATLAALEILAEVGASTHPMVRHAVDWAAGIANADGGLPTVLPSADGHPRAPWMQPNADSGFLTYAITAQLWNLGVEHPWLDRATAWCWEQIDSADTPAGYTVTFALDFLDAVPDPYPAPGPWSSPRISARASSTCPMVASSTTPIRRSNREETTARTARHTARLGRSMPAGGATSTRSADGDSELDKGTTTIRSPGAPVLSSSSETTTAGRVLPGSPARPAPSATSQISRRRGASAKAILESGFPFPQLGLAGGILRVDATGLPFRAPDGLAPPLVGNLGKQRCQRHPAFACLLGKQVASRARYADGARLTSHATDNSA